MKGINTWSYHPYRPFLTEVGNPYICRVVPHETAIHVEWLSTGEGEYRILYRKRGEGDFILFATTRELSCDITGLSPACDYEFFVEASEGKSRVRLARCGASVGTAVNYLHPEDGAYAFSGQYLCSPSLVRHPDGFLLASMDLFRAEGPQNLTLIFRSDDEGATWHYQSELMPCFWGKMFIHRGELYMLACSTEYGDLLIGRSTDGGKTFSAPVSLLRGSNGKEGYDGVHKNPQNVVFHGGRLYCTLEWGTWHNKARYHSAMVMSCDENADLLDPESWHFTPPVVYDPTWEGTSPDGKRGNIEGTLCVAPGGELYNLMRYQTDDKKILAYRVRTEDPDLPLVYSHAVAFPGNLSKFMIKYDEISERYYSIVCRRLDEPKTVRNLLSLISSRDLREWELVTDLHDYRDADPKAIGFQYVDFEMEGEDIIYLSRTAMNGANSFHNSNYQTFHRIKHFRNL